MLTARHYTRRVSASNDEPLQRQVHATVGGKAEANIGPCPAARQRRKRNAIDDRGAPNAQHQSHHDEPIDSCDLFAVAVDIQAARGARSVVLKARDTETRRCTELAATADQQIVIKKIKVITGSALQRNGATEHVRLRQYLRYEYGAPRFAAGIAIKARIGSDRLGVAYGAESRAAKSALSDDHEFSIFERHDALSKVVAVAAGNRSGNRRGPKTTTREGEKPKCAHFISPGAADASRLLRANRAGVAAFR